jgi:hypothetical protein
MLPKSIDDLFTAYGRGKIQGLQAQALQSQIDAQRQSQATARAGFAMQNGGLTPEDVNTFLPQAMGPQPTTLPPGMMPGPQPSPFQYQPGQSGPVPYQQPNEPPTGLGQPQPVQEDPRVTTLRGIMRMHLQGAQIGAAQQVAGLQKTQAEGQKLSAEAGLAESQIRMLDGGGGAGSVIDNYVNQIKSGKMTYDDLSNLGRGEIANAIRTGVSNALASQGVNTNALSNQQSQAKSLATGAALPLANTKSLQSALDVLESLNQDTPRESLQLINKLGLQVAAERGDRAANRLLGQAGLVSDMFQANFGQGSDKKLELAQSLANPKQTSSQLSDTINMVKADMRNRVTALGGGQGMEHPKFADAGNRVNVGDRARQIITEGTRSGKSREQIKSELKAAGF